MTARLTPEAKAANKARRAEMRRRLAPAGRVQHIKPWAERSLTPTQRSKAALGEPTGKAGHLGSRRAAMTVAKARRGADVPRVQLPRLDTAPALPPGDDWPDRRQCCWPTSSGRPWTFCREPVAEGSRYGYCAGHEAKNRGQRSAEAGNVGKRDFTLPRAIDHAANGAKAARSAAAQLAQRGPRKPK